MDPVTHAVVGSALYKLTGQEISLGNPQFVAIITGSVLPDIDIIFKRKGLYVYLKNHRGISHSLVVLSIISLVISYAISLLYTPLGFLNIYLFVFLGCLSHITFDILNSYGAKIFWPFIKSKISLNLFMLFDPIIFILLVGIILANNLATIIFSTLFFSYVLFRAALKLVTKYKLSKLYNINSNKVVVLPSFTRIDKWQFIINFDNCSVVGQKSMFTDDIYILKRFNKVDDYIEQKITSTKVGCFFKDFTPLYNINHSIKDGKNIFTLTDMRHYLAGNFMHHADIICSKNFEIKREIFYPYSRNVKVYL